MVQINYIEQSDELEVVFKEVDIPEVVKMDNGIIFEFDSENLSAIILPHFWQMIYQQLMYSANPNDSSIEFDSFSEDLLKLKVNGQNVNIKLDLSKIEN